MTFAYQLPYDMVWLLYLFLLLLALVLYLLFAPFYLEINSILGLYRIRFHRIISASLKSDNGSFFLVVQFLGLARNIYLMQPASSKKVSTRVPKEPKKNRRRISLSKIMAVLRTFQVRRCVWKLDSGDNQTNGLLFPVFYWLGRITRHEFKVNFSGENVLILEIKNNAARMLWGYLKS